MQFDNQKTRNVADIVAKILAGESAQVNEKLHPNQQKLDVHEPEKDELTADDFKKLRAGKKPADVKKEEVEIDEASSFIKGVKRFVAGKKNPSDVRDSHLAKSTFSSDPKVREKEGRRYDRVQNVISKEEVEQIQEYESKGGVYKHKGTYGTAKGAEYGETDYDKENEMAKNDSKPKKPARKKYGARQNYVRSSRVNESFSNLLNVYKETGLKGLSEALVKEEPTNDEYKSELEDHKAKAEGKKKQPELHKGSVQAVKSEKTEIAVIDADKANGVQIETIDEKEMTPAEMEKREKIVKGMKKGLEGFKQRYGDRAKSVMYATATKQAMK